MKEIYCDLHVHLGSDWDGAPVKITASPKMTVQRILSEARERKGIDIVGIVDTLGATVRRELRSLCQTGVLCELPDGGLRHKNGITLIVGGEVETREGAHFISYFPDLGNLEGFARAISPFITNMNLSSQRARLSLSELVSITGEYQGIVIAAHAFTPHKGVYGFAVRRLADLFPGQIPRTLKGIELGLSADTRMAARISETHRFTYLTNSDAHSLGKMAREYNILSCKEASWKELVAALDRKEERQVVANYGMAPPLGKYHRTWCPACGFIAHGEGIVETCPLCKSAQVVLGVQDRIELLADLPYIESPKGRPPYRYQIPLDFIPGLGKRTLVRLLAAFNTEMYVLHQASYSDLARVVGEVLALRIVLARKGQLDFLPGGGGKYGKILLPQL